MLGLSCEPTLIETHTDFFHDEETMARLNCYTRFLALGHRAAASPTVFLSRKATSGGNNRSGAVAVAANVALRALGCVRSGRCLMESAASQTPDLNRISGTAQNPTRSALY
jgi:hypothetical protein